MSQSETKPRVTISTVAKKVGCSRTSVSYVLNGQWEEMNISRDLADRVMKAAQELHYVPNDAARSLRSRSTGLIGVIIPRLVHEWPERLMRGMHDILDVDGSFHPLVLTRGFDQKREREEIEFLIRRQVEAIICAPLNNEENYELVMQHQIPLVFLSQPFHPMPQASWVDCDDRAATRAALHTLLDAGRRKVAFVGNLFPSQMLYERREAFLEEIEKLDLKVPSDWMIDLRADCAEELHRMAIAKVFDRENRPDALLCVSWMVGMQVMDALDQLGLKIPGDVSLIAIGDNLACRHSRIAMTVVDQPYEELGRQAALVCLELIRKGGNQPTQRIIESYQLIRRATA